MAKREYEGKHTVKKTWIFLCGHGHFLISEPAAKATAWQGGLGKFKYTELTLLGVTNANNLTIVTSSISNALGLLFVARCTILCKECISLCVKYCTGTTFD